MCSAFDASHVLSAVHAGSDAALAGLAVGDIVTEVNGKSVHLASFGSLLRSLLLIFRLNDY